MTSSGYGRMPSIARNNTLSVTFRMNNDPSPSATPASPDAAEKILSNVLIPSGLSNIAVIVLGLLAESPTHPYDLEKKIEDRGYREWTVIGFSSIYSILKGLEKQCLVEVSSEVVKSRTRRIYQLTPQGRDLLKQEISRILESPEHPKAEWDLGVAYMFGLLSYDEQVERLQAYRIRILQHITELENRSHEFPDDDIATYRETYHIKALFDHPIFLNKSRTQIRRGFNFPHPAHPK